MAGKSGAIRAGKAFVELFADDSKLRRTLASVSARFKSWGAGISKIGAGLGGISAIVTGPLTAAAGVFSAMGDQLDKMSLRTGVSTEALSQLAFAAEQCGSGVETLETGIKGMQKNLENARRGSKEAVDTFAALGLTMEELDKLSPDEQFTLIADRLSKIEDPSKRAAMAMLAFGRSGQQLLPMIAGGAEGINALRTEADALGLTMSTEDSAAAAAFADALNRLKKQLKQVVFTIGAAVGPVLTKWLKLTVGAGKAAIDWAKDNKGLVSTVFMVATGIGVAGASLMGLGLLFSATGVAIGGFSAILGFVGSAIGFVLSPIGLLIGGLTALGYWFVTSSEAGGVALQWLRDRFGALATDALGAFDAIKAALQRGDFGAAAGVAWGFLNVQWTKGMAFISGVWNDGLMGMLNAWASIQTSLAKGWVETVGFLADVWSGFSAGFNKSLAGSQNRIANWIIDAQVKSGAITAEEGEKRRTILNEDHGRRVSDIDAGRDADVSAREDQRKSILAEIDDSAARDRDNRKSEAEGKVAAALERVAQAQADYQAKLDAATAADQTALGTLGGDSPQMGALAAASASGLSKGPGASGGTFSQMADRMFLTANPEADAAKETAKNTKIAATVLSKMAKNGGLVYGA